MLCYSAREQLRLLTVHVKLQVRSYIRVYFRVQVQRLASVHATVPAHHILQDQQVAFGLQTHI